MPRAPIHSLVQHFPLPGVQSELSRRCPHLPLPRDHGDIGVRLRAMHFHRHPSKSITITFTFVSLSGINEHQSFSCRSFGQVRVAASSDFQNCFQHTHPTNKRQRYLRTADSLQFSQERFLFGFHGLSSILAPQLGQYGASIIHSNSPWHKGTCL